MQMGIVKGAKVALLLQNGPEILETSYALFKIGAVAVPLNFRLAGNEIEYVLNNADAEFLVLGDEFFETIKAEDKELVLVPESYHVLTTDPAFVDWGWDKLRDWLNSH